MHHIQAPETSQPVVELLDVAKTYAGAGGVPALNGVTVAFGAGTFCAVMGPSGSGKSTLLHCAAGLDRPDRGEVRLAGEDLSRLKEPALTKTRRRRVGFVFQTYNLMDSLTVWQNVLLPQKLAGMRPDKAHAREVLAGVGLAGDEHTRPGRLSGGQRQRVALARALALRPQVIFADEPTGALDLTTGREVLALLRQAVDTFGTSVVMVTHDPAAAAWADRVVILADGHLVADLGHASADQIAGQMMQVSA